MQPAQRVSRVVSKTGHPPTPSAICFEMSPLLHFQNEEGWGESTLTNSFNPRPVLALYCDVGQILSREPLPLPLPPAPWLILIHSEP